MASRKLVEAIAATAELCGRTFTEAAAAVFVADLAEHPEHQVMVALQRCRREVRSVLTVADVLCRMDDGRPGTEEAWSIALGARDEHDSVVWTAEIAHAWSVARVVYAQGDEVGARMAFKEVYAKTVDAARRDRQPTTWILAEGYDRAGRAEALRTAAAQGRIVEGAEHLLALPNPHAPVALLEGPGGDDREPLSPLGRTAIRRMQALLEARRADRADLDSEARRRADELRAASAAKVAAYASANGIDLGTAAHPELSQEEDQ